MSYQFTASELWTTLFGSVELEMEKVNIFRGSLRKRFLSLGKPVTPDAVAESQRELKRIIFLLMLLISLNKF